LCCCWIEQKKEIQIKPARIIDQSTNQKFFIIHLLNELERLDCLSSIMIILRIAAVYNIFRAGVAPQVFLEATHEKTLEYVSLEELIKFAYKS